MGQITIRTAAPEDVDDLIAIEADADQRFVESSHPDLAGGSTVPSAVLQRAIAQNRVFVAVDHACDRVVGWVLLTRSAGELCIGQISVRRDAGRSGVGTEILEHVITTARNDGEPSIVLNTQRDVPWNKPWYERHGFVVVDETDWNGDMRVITAEQVEAGLDWSTRVHMRLRLG